MGYKEQVIDGVLHYQNNDGLPWHEFTPQELTDQIADQSRAYELLFAENAKLRELVELIFASTLPYNDGEPTFSKKVTDAWKELAPNAAPASRT